MQAHQLFLGREGESSSFGVDRGESTTKPCLVRGALWLEELGAHVALCLEEAAFEFAAHRVHLPDLVEGERKLAGDGGARCGFPERSPIGDRPGLLFEALAHRGAHRQTGLVLTGILRQPRARPRRGGCGSQRRGVRLETLGRAR